MTEKRHYWTYDENEYCVQEVFKNFVIDKEYNYDDVIFDIYLHFNQNIKISSIKMKLQNIKYLLNKYNVPNTLVLAPLENASYDNEIAFLARCKKYNDIKI